MAHAGIHSPSMADAGLHDPSMVDGGIHDPSWLIGPGTQGRQLAQLGRNRGEYPHTGE